MFSNFAKFTNPNTHTHTHLRTQLKHIEKMNARNLDYKNVGE